MCLKFKELPKNVEKSFKQLNETPKKSEVPKTEICKTPKFEVPGTLLVTNTL